MDQGNASALDSADVELKKVQQYNYQQYVAAYGYIRNGKMVEPSKLTPAYLACCAVSALRKVTEIMDSLFPDKYPNPNVQLESTNKDPEQIKEIRKWEDTAQKWIEALQYPMAISRYMFKVDEIEKPWYNDYQHLQVGQRKGHPRPWYDQAHTLIRVPESLDQPVYSQLAKDYIITDTEVVCLFSPST